MASIYSNPETSVLRQDWMVERRGFEPLTSAVQAPARLTGSSLPFLVGDVGDSWNRP
jgi:hypothetical protein